MLLATLSNKLINLKAKLAVRGDAHATIEQHLENLTAQKDANTEKATHMLVVEAKIGQVRKAIKELEEEILIDNFDPHFAFFFFLFFLL